MLSGKRILELAVVLGVLAGLYWLVRIPEAESPQTAPAERGSEVAEGVEAELESEAADSTSEPVTRREAEEGKPDVVEGEGAHVLRLILDGLSESSATEAQVTVSAGEETATWSCEGLSSEFDLTPFLGASEVEVLVAHPERYRSTSTLLLGGGVEEDGRTVHELLVHLPEPGFWPQLTLSVLDAETREHLDDVTLNTLTSAMMASPMMPYEASVFSPLGSDFESPILLAGSYDVLDEEQRVGGVRLVSDVPRFLELSSFARVTPERQVIVYVSAPGYAWETIGVDFSKDTEREVLLQPGGKLEVQVSNVQLERYAELGASPWLCVNWIRPEGGYSRLRWEKLVTLDEDGLKLEGVVPGDYSVQVELRGQPWTKTTTILGQEEISIAGGESKEVFLTLDDAPAPFETATLSGTISFPEFGHEDQVELQFYKADTYTYVGEESRYQLETDAEFTIHELREVPSNVPGDLPTWAFRLEGAPIGLYQLHLKPFLKSWMVELPREGREVELVISELAEVSIEVVDAESGELVPIDQLYFRPHEVVEGQAHRDRVPAVMDEPGRFRFWTTPGGVSFWPWNIPEELNYGSRAERMQLVAGQQSFRFELWRPCELLFELHLEGELLPRWDDLWQEIYVGVVDRITPIDHDGEVRSIGGFTRTRTIGVSVPGIYEIDLNGVGEERFHPLGSQQVTVRPGTPAKVILQLREK